MRDKFYRQVTGALCLVRGCGDTCMRECGPEPLRIECARRPGSRASIDRPVAGTRWQSARTPNPRGQADREEGSVRAEGAGAHLWDHHDHLQRPGRPPSRQPESLGCRPEVPAKYGLAEPPHLGVNRPPSRALTAWTTMVAMRCERGLAFRSPLHARALQLKPKPRGCRGLTTSRYTLIRYAYVPL